MRVFLFVFLFNLSYNALVLHVASTNTQRGRTYHMNFEWMTDPTSVIAVLILIGAVFYALYLRSKPLDYKRTLYLSIQSIHRTRTNKGE